MKTYDLYLDSGPKMKKTTVQVPALAGCTVRGDATDAAIAAAPEAIRRYTRFLARRGERADPDARFTTRVAEHRTNGVWPGSGIDFMPPDAKPLSVREADALLDRLGALHSELRALTAALTAKQLVAAPVQGRPIARILAHVCVEGAYLRGVAGASRIQREVDDGRRDPHDALDQLLALERERIHAMTPSERNDVIRRGQQAWTARAAIRRMLEHMWEHHTEIARRLGRDP